MLKRNDNYTIKHINYPHVLNLGIFARDNTKFSYDGISMVMLSSYVEIPSRKRFSELPNSMLYEESDDENEFPYDEYDEQERRDHYAQYESGTEMFIYTLNRGYVAVRGAPVGETVLAITNKYLITYHNTLDELRLWAIDSLSNFTFIKVESDMDAIDDILDDTTPIIKPTPTIRLTPPNSRKTPSEISNVKVIVGENDSFLFIREVAYGTGDNKEKVLEATKYKTGVYTIMDEFYKSLME